MQEAAVEPGRRPQQHQFAGVDLRRPKGYAPSVAAKGGVEGGEPCPRCASRDTKFCYYNNYNTTQPRHFCKGCRRYWTKGGTLRNVPVGGGTRKKPSYDASKPPPPPKKKPATKKRRVVAPAPAPDPAAGAVSVSVTDPVAAKTTTDGASEITMELETAAAAMMPPPAAAEEEHSDSLAHLLLQPGAEAEAVALGLGLSDFPSAAAGKALIDVDDSFVWPATFDLGACWATAGIADPEDPAGIFLNLP